jgi:hypothetical protein
MGVVVGVVRGAGVPLAAGFGATVGAGESFGEGVGVGVVFSSFLTAKAEFWARAIATKVKARSSFFMRHDSIRFAPEAAS